ncbi:DUF6464 family protein [Leptolyngbya sp. AN02str]|uniref:DUF6464 family protein n=1 Tax=Leptolyngbya sp. AN02str TaxID=3423363 RepID=UPI003D32333F
MQPNKEQSLPTEVILNSPRQSLGYVMLDGSTQPGTYFDLKGETYTVLERRHRYQLKAGKYQLEKIALYVQQVHHSEERTLWGEKWVVGDATCLYNAHSEILRCGVNPVGPCRDCRHYKKQ